MTMAGGHGNAMPALSAHVSTENAVDAAAVAFAEQVEMNKEVVELVEGLALLIARRQREDLIVGLIKVRRETAKECRHCEVGLAVTEVRGGVDDDRLAAQRDHPVAAPEVAMQQRRVRKTLVEPPVQPLDELVEAAGALAGQEAPLCRQVALDAEPLTAVEVNPGAGAAVLLWQLADIVVVLKPVAGVDLLVLHGELPPQLAGGVIPASVTVDPLQNKVLGVAVRDAPMPDHIGHADSAGIAQQAYTARLAVEESGRGRLVPLDEIAVLCRRDTRRVVDVTTADG